MRVRVHICAHCPANYTTSAFDPRTVRVVYYYIEVKSGHVDEMVERRRELHPEQYNA